ncbi:MAG TPA: SLOG family protein [Candidatus Lumbricidophila sp.]|nr:SLOG family protein [Candidatus Lumbricidophila sp.]
MTSIALTGHRPTKLDGYRLDTSFYARLGAALAEIADTTVRSDLATGQITTLHSGMALGADTLWAQQIVSVKRRYPSQVKFVAHVPFPGQPDRWPAHAQVAYQRLLNESDSIRVYGDTYSSIVMQRRNVGMIDAADTLIAVYDGSDSGGTANAVRYARSVLKPMISLHPHTFRAAAQQPAWTN